MAGFSCWPKHFPKRMAEDDAGNCQSAKRQKNDPLVLSRRSYNAGRILERNILSYAGVAASITQSGIGNQLSEMGSKNQRNIWCGFVSSSILY